MSTTRLSELAGTSTSIGQVSVAAGKKLKIDADSAIDFSKLDSALQLPTGTTAQRPGSPSAGFWRFNTSSNEFEVYDGSAWDNIPEAAAAGGGGGGDYSDGTGTSSVNYALSPREAYNAGTTSGNEIFLKVGDNVLPYEYDPSDRFGTGHNGWAKFDMTHAGQYYQVHEIETFGTPYQIMPAFSNNSTYQNHLSDDSIKQGVFRIGRNYAHPGGNSLTFIRYRMPKMTRARYYKVDISNQGDQSPDYGTGWNSGSAFNGVNGRSAWESNGNGYWFVIWSGRTSGQGGSKGNDWLILDNGNNSSDNYTSSVQAFPQGQAAGNPWAMWGTTDAYREMVYYRNWYIWFH